MISCYLTVICLLFFPYLYSLPSSFLTSIVFPLLPFCSNASCNLTLSSYTTCSSSFITLFISSSYSFSLTSLIPSIPLPLYSFLPSSPSPFPPPLFRSPFPPPFPSIPLYPSHFQEHDEPILKRLADIKLSYTDSKGMVRHNNCTYHVCKISYFEE